MSSSFDYDSLGGSTLGEELTAANAAWWRNFSVLLAVVAAVFVPPLALTAWACARDPQLPIVARLLWLRAQELVGVPAPSEAAFLARLRRERNEQLRRAAAVQAGRLPPPARERAPAAGGAGAGAGAGGAVVDASAAGAASAATAGTTPRRPPPVPSPLASPRADAVR